MDYEQQTEQPPIFFPVSNVKLLVMSICTFGLYELYWFYKNWELIEERESRNLSPFWRAFFWVFFCYSLFKIISEKAATVGLRPTFNPGLIAIAYIGLYGTYGLPGSVWLISMLTFLPLLLVQSAVNRLNKQLASGIDQNVRFSGSNIAVVVIWGVLFILGVIGTFIPD